VRARRLVVLLLALLAFYAVTLGLRALDLLRDPRLVFKGLGLGVLLLPLLGVGLVTAELRLARAAERLGQRLRREPGDMVGEELARRPSGRIDRAAADAAFARRRAEVEAAPGDWRAWYCLGLAYGDAGDSSRGRRAVRRAVALEAAERQDPRR